METKLTQMKSNENVSERFADKKVRLVVCAYFFFCPLTFAGLKIKHRKRDACKWARLNTPYGVSHQTKWKWIVARLRLKETNSCLALDVAAHFTNAFRLANGPHRACDFSRPTNRRREIIRRMHGLAYLHVDQTITYIWFIFKMGECFLAIFVLFNLLKWFSGDAADRNAAGMRRRFGTWFISSNFHEATINGPRYG